MLIPGRKSHRTEFPIMQKLVPSVLLLLLFAAGLAVLFQFNAALIIAYLAMWIISYPVIYAGACRYCAYYGTPCPVILEGGMVHWFFARAHAPFGTMQIIWASCAYALRIAMPAIVIIQNRLWIWGVLYGSIFVLYWFFHLRITGCPHCVNYQCPLNPGKNNR